MRYHIRALVQNSPVLVLLTEIGVALTTFGALFMLLGVMMFFDGSLLALGNLCASWKFE